MSLTKTTFGNFELFTIETGDFTLDGGAMFGVVPKSLWSRRIQPDEQNQIPMTMRCLLIKSKQTGKVYLIDNGAGTKFNEKMESIYQLDYSTKNLLGSLKFHGFNPEDVTDVIFTHLHFDHCGGTTYYDDAHNLKETFPKAKYHVHKEQWASATNPNAREIASFFPENIQPIANSGRLNLVENGQEFEPGLSFVRANGHTTAQMLPKLDTDKQTLVFAADLIPTRHHLPLPYVMGYDMRAEQTLIEKQEFLDRAIAENWLLFLEHDYDQEVIRVGIEKGKYAVSEFLTLAEI